MLSWRWGGAILVAALSAGGAILWTRKDGDVHAAPQPWSDAGLTLAGVVEANGVELGRLVVRCYSLRPEARGLVHQAELDAQGRFELTGLSDEGYRIEVAARANPALVLARMDHVRAGGEELVLRPDPEQLFGPAGLDRD